MDSGNVRQFDIGKMEAEPTYLSELFHQFDIRREFCIHCRVLKYDRDNNTVDVELLPSHTRKVGDKVEEIKRAAIKDINILSYAHGGVVMQSDVYVGDTGYVIACDRSCNAIMGKNSSLLYCDDNDGMENVGVGMPDDNSLTRFSNGFFIPCSWAKIEDVDKDGCFVIKSIGAKKGDGKWSKFSMSKDGKVSIKTVESELTVDNSGILARKRVSVSGDKRNVSIDPDADLGNTDAKFREIVVLTGLKDESNKTVRLAAKKIRVLADEADEYKEVAFKVGDDIPEGKLIKTTRVNISADPGGQNEIIFYYTDGTHDTFSVANGLNGFPGDPGRDGETPEITAEKHGNRTYIYANGEQIAVINDGSSPQITTSKVGKITTIYANGVPIGTVKDGEDGQGGGSGSYVEHLFVSDVTFSYSNGKVVAAVTKKKGKFIGVVDSGVSNVDVLTTKNLDVVTGSTYSTTSHDFNNNQKNITVIDIGSSKTQQVFVAVPNNYVP